MLAVRPWTVGSIISGMTKSENPPDAEAPPLRELAEFLQRAPPLVPENVSAECEYNPTLSRWELILPPLRLYCTSDDCDAECWFDPMGRPFIAVNSTKNAFLHFAQYKCRHCLESVKAYALSIAHEDMEARLSGGTPIRVVKFGEIPAAMGPTPQALRELLGKEAWPLYLKGRRAELAGLGMGAFVYYRRAIEHIWQRVLDRLIEVAAVEPTADRQTALAAAKAEPHFTRSLEAAQSHVPPSLYVDRHNPFQALYNACGDGIHELNDEQCIARAEVIRVVLTKFAERAAAVIREDKEFHAAVGKLTNPNSGQR